MIILKHIARDLHAKGQIDVLGKLYHNNKTYWILNNLKEMRTDHLFYDYGDLRNCTETFQQFIQ